MVQGKGAKEGTIWNGRVGLGKGIFIHLQYLRWDQPDFPKNEYNKLQNPDFIILGGWHHDPESIDANRIVNFLQQVHRRWSEAKIIVRNKGLSILLVIIPILLNRVSRRMRLNR